MAVSVCVALATGLPEASTNVTFTRTPHAAKRCERLTSTRPYVMKVRSAGCVVLNPRFWTMTLLLPPIGDRAFAGPGRQAIPIAKATHAQTGATSPLHCRQRWPIYHIISTRPPPRQRPPWAATLDPGASLVANPILRRVGHGEAKAIVAKPRGFRLRSG
jgi:hypothetical protein